MLHLYFREFRPLLLSAVFHGPDPATADVGEGLAVGQVWGLRCKPSPPEGGNRLLACSRWRQARHSPLRRHGPQEVSNRCLSGVFALTPRSECSWGQAWGAEWSEEARGGTFQARAGSKTSVNYRTETEASTLNHYPGTSSVEPAELIKGLHLLWIQSRLGVCLGNKERSGQY